LEDAVELGRLATGQLLADGRRQGEARAVGDGDLGAHGPSGHDH
jgi:hypothetical protein